MDGGMYSDSNRTATLIFLYSVTCSLIASSLSGPGMNVRPLITDKGKIIGTPRPRSRF